jgi:hypothetical protein
MYIIGIVFVLVGVVSLLENLGFLPVGFWEFFWPALLIVIGLSLLCRSRCKECAGKIWCTCKKKKTEM